MGYSNHEIRSAIRSGMQSDEGNWRFKALALAACTGQAKEVGAEWPTSDRFLSEKARQDPRLCMDQTVVPASTNEDTNERSLARAEFGDLEWEREMSRDKYIKRMLLQDDVTELDTLWREELSTTLIMGAEPRKIARDVVPTMPANKRTGDIPRGSAGTFAPKVAQGANITINQEGFDTVPFACERYGNAFAVTDEMVESADIGVIEEQVRYVGASIENALNRVVVEDLIDNVGNEHDTVGANQGAPALNGAQTEISMDNFGPATEVIAHPEYMEVLFNDTNLVYANRFGDRSPVSKRRFNEVLGLTLNEASDNVVSSDATQTWGFAADGEIGAVLVDPTQASIVMWKDMQMKEFEDPLKDLQGGSVRSYFDFVRKQDNAHCRIEY